MRGILDFIGGKELSKTCPECGEYYVDADSGKCPWCQERLDKAEKLKKMVSWGVVVLEDKPLFPNSPPDRNGLWLSLMVAAYIIIITIAMFFPWR